MSPRNEQKDRIMVPHHYGYLNNTSTMRTPTGTLKWKEEIPEASSLDKELLQTLATEREIISHLQGCAHS